MACQDFPEFSSFEENEEECPHTTTKTINSKSICVDCCQILEGDFSYSEQENSTFGTKRTNTTRAQTNPDEKRTIYKDLENLNPALPHNVIRMANDMYQKIMEKKGKTMIKRGKRRKGVIIVCIYHALRQNKEIRSVSDVAEMFGEQKGAVSYGLKEYGRVFRESLTEYTEPSDLIRRIITKCGISIEFHDEIRDFCEAVQGKSQMLKSAVPQSVASAVVYLWQTLNKEKPSACYVSRRQFAEQVSLSEATVTKLAKEIARLEGKDVKL